MHLLTQTLRPGRFLIAVAFLVALLSLAACSSGDASVPLGPDDVEFAATDGTVLRGHHYGSGDVTVVLAHMLPSDQESWTEFAGTLNAEGYAAFSFNFRGFKPSQGDKDIDQIDKDLEGALEYLEGQGVEKFVIIGASMGGTAAVKVASYRDLVAIVTLSAPLEIQGLSAEEDITRVTAPAAFFSAEDDRNAQRSAAAYNDATLGPKMLETFIGSEHGTALLYGQHADAIQERIFEWLAFAEGLQQ
jgi:pimeloyl-ACP methyl ester carboxylesterase